MCAILQPRMLERIAFLFSITKLKTENKTGSHLPLVVFESATQSSSDHSVFRVRTSCSPPRKFAVRREVEQAAACRPLMTNSLKVTGFFDTSTDDA